MHCQHACSDAYATNVAARGRRRPCAVGTVGNGARVSVIIHAIQPPVAPTRPIRPGSRVGVTEIQLAGGCLAVHFIRDVFKAGSFTRNARPRVVPVVVRVVKRRRAADALHFRAGPAVLLVVVLVAGTVIRAMVEER